MKNVNSRQTKNCISYPKKRDKFVMPKIKCRRCGGQGDLSTGIQTTALCHICNGKGVVSIKTMIFRLQKEIRYGLRGRKHTEEMKDHLKMLVDKAKYKFLHRL